MPAPAPTAAPPAYFERLGPGRFRATEHTGGATAQSRFDTNYARDASTSFWTKMRKNLGSKGREISDVDRARVVQLYADFTDADPDYSKVLSNEDFGYWALAVERPVLDEAGNPLVDRKGKHFPLACSAGYSEVLNCLPLALSFDKDRLDRFDFVGLYFTDETPERCREVIDAFADRQRVSGETTRGLYYRGVL